MRKYTKNVTKSELVKHIYYNQEKGSRLFMYILEDVADIFFENIGDAMVDGETVFIRGFGTFYPIRTATKKLHKYVPSKGEKITCFHTFSSRIFRPSRKLLRRLNRGGLDVFEHYFTDSSDN